MDILQVVQYRRKRKCGIDKMNKLLSATLLLGLQLSALLLDLVVAGGGDTYWSYDDGKTVKTFRGKLLPIAS